MHFGITYSCVAAEFITNSSLQLGYFQQAILNYIISAHLDGISLPQLHTAVNIIQCRNAEMAKK